MAVRGINKVVLIGRLGKDPEVRYIPNGGAVANLQVATSESWRDKQTGEMREYRCRFLGDICTCSCCCFFYRGYKNTFAEILFVQRE